MPLQKIAALETVMEPATESANRRTLWVLSALCLVQLLPFIARPMHIDDPMFVWTAQHIAHHPLDFYGFAVNWEGTDRPVAKIFPIPPLTSYYLAAVSRVAGWSEWKLHLAFLPVSLLTTIGIYLLAARFCRRPGLCTLLVLLCPAFWVSSTTLMCDGLLLCLWVWTVLLWIWGCDRSGWFYLPCVVTLACAVLTKFTALGLFPLLALHALLRPAPRRVRVPQAFTLLFAAFTTGCYVSVFAKLYGVGALANAADYSTRSRALMNIPLGPRLADSMVFTGGGAFTACVVIVGVLWRPWASLAVLGSAIFCTLILASSALPPGGWLAHTADAAQPGLSVGSVAFWFQFSLMLCLATALAVHGRNLLMRGLRAGGGWRDDIFLLSWIAGIFIFAAFMNWSINIRSILPMIPAVCIVVVRGLDPLRSLPPRRTAIALALGGAVALAVTIGDYHLAATAKNAAKVIADDARRSHSPGNTRAALWLTGHWGLQYYLQPLGFTELDIFKPAYRSGDLVLFSSNGFGGSVNASGFILVRQITFGSVQWVSTAEPAIGAGFYLSDGYALPFVFGPVPPQRFMLVKVTADSRVKR